MPTLLSLRDREEGGLRPDMLPLEDFLRQMAFNRECQRAYMNAASHTQRKRLYKSVVVLDLAGLSFAHSDKR